VQASASTGAAAPTSRADRRVTPGKETDNSSGSSTATETLEDRTSPLGTTFTGRSPTRSAKRSRWATAAPSANATRRPERLGRQQSLTPAAPLVGDVQRQRRGQPRPDHHQQWAVPAIRDADQRDRQRQRRRHYAWATRAPARPALPLGGSDTGDGHRPRSRIRRWVKTSYSDFSTTGRRARLMPSTARATRSTTAATKPSRLVGDREDDYQFDYSVAGSVNATCHRDLVYQGDRRR